MLAAISNRLDTTFPAMLAAICVIAAIILIFVLRDKRKNKIIPRFIALAGSARLDIKTEDEQRNFETSLDQGCIEVSTLRPNSSIRIKTTGGTFDVTVLDPKTCECAVSKAGGIMSTPDVWLLTGTSWDSTGALVRLGGINPTPGFHIVFQYPGAQRFMILPATTEVAFV